MTDSMLTLDKQQLAKIELIVLDQDEKAALKFITEINRKFKISRVGCDPFDQKMREGLNAVVGKNKRK